ncbi:deoxyguanosinetriphosphate triphosphohydrolase [Candidatus Omnitrophota bacterium]
MKSRKQIEEFEDQYLASYAMHSKNTKGRVHEEKKHDYRSAYQRDRDRVVHCAAFRRLEYKTQVFVNHEGDYYRTRLTHTLEVAQIARTIARALRLNEDLVEAMALAHDVGHPPYGHAGEEALKEQMQGHGGFEHNLQSLRVVDVLEERYPHFNGLNLSWEVREGLVKHSGRFDHPAAIPQDFEPDTQPTLEAQVVNISDEIAYDNHDLDDGITSDLIDLEHLRELKFWDDLYLRIKKQDKSISDILLKYQIIRSLIELQVTDLLTETQRRIKKLKLTSLENIKSATIEIASFSDTMQSERNELKQYLTKNLYHHHRVNRMANKAKRFIQQLFNVYLEDPQQLPPAFQSNIDRDGQHKVICDYIASMTDRFAEDEHKKLFDPYEKV